jgi:hypothetical protein
MQVAIYYAARSYVEIERPTIVGSAIQVAIPLTVAPPKLATAAVGDRMRIRIHGVDGQASPILRAVVVAKAEELASHRLVVAIEEWDKLARYWRARFEAASDTD